MMNQTMIERLDEQEYSFFLAHGVTNEEDLYLQELLDEYLYCESV